MNDNGGPDLHYTTRDYNCPLLPGCDIPTIENPNIQIDFIKSIYQKGNVSVRRENTIFLQEIFIQIMYLICMDYNNISTNKNYAKDLINTAILYLFQFRFTLSKLMKTAEIGSKYAADDPKYSKDNPNAVRKLSLPAHVILARQLTELGDCRESGERINSIYTYNKVATNSNEARYYKGDLHEFIQEPDHWRKNGCLPRLNFCKYIESQFESPIGQIFDTLYQTTEFEKYISSIKTCHHFYTVCREELKTYYFANLMNHTFNFNNPTKFIYIKANLKPNYVNQQNNKINNKKNNKKTIK